MDIYVIPPLSNPGLMNYGDRVFVLAQHYLKNGAYRDYIKHLKEQGKWITLDNGAGDYDTITQEKLMTAVKDLLPNEVIPLDILFDHESTLKNLEEFYFLLEKEGLHETVEIFACPQGKTKEDWLFCYKEMLDKPYVKTIGFSKIAIPHAWGVGGDDQNIMEARHSCYEELMSKGLIQKPIHCLGAGDPREFLKYTDNPLMRSTDSCFSVWAGMNFNDWSEGQFERIKTPHDYFNRMMTPEQTQLAIKNIDFLKQIVKTKTNGQEAAIQS